MASKEITFISDIPHLLAQWHPTKNDNLPSAVNKASTKKVWWVCEKGHEWQASVMNRYYKHSGCPYCWGRVPVPGENDLATVNPSLAKEWHPTRNRALTPSDISKGSKKQVWWLCPHGHEWKASVANRTNVSGCPECANIKRRQPRTKTNES